MAGGRKRGPLQRFYPQCQRCSIKQATAVRNGKRVLVLHLHWPRLNRGDTLAGGWGRGTPGQQRPLQSAALMFACCGSLRPPLIGLAADSAVRSVRGCQFHKCGPDSIICPPQEAAAGPIFLCSGQNTLVHEGWPMRDGLAEGGTLSNKAGRTGRSGSQSNVHVLGVGPPSW